MVSRRRTGLQAPRAGRLSTQAALRKAPSTHKMPSQLTQTLAGGRQASQAFMTLNSNLQERKREGEREREGGGGVRVEKHEGKGQQAAEQQRRPHMLFCSKAFSPNRATSRT